MPHRWLKIARLEQSLLAVQEFGKVYKYYEKSPLLEFLEAVPNQEASYAS